VSSGHRRGPQLDSQLDTWSQLTLASELLSLGRIFDDIWGMRVSWHMFGVWADLLWNAEHDIEKPTNKDCTHNTHPCIIKWSQPDT
jgi:hypothetical protein